MPSRQRRGYDLSGEPFLMAATIPAERAGAMAGYPLDIPAIRALVAPRALAFHSRVTYFVGENGTGKSTLIEAIAIAAGFNPEGGSKHFAFATRRTESSLHEVIRLVRGVRRERDGFFLRAESLYNVASEIEALEADAPGLLDAYGGVSLHARSHGEAFIALATHRFRDQGLYLLDEPEAALSPQRQLALLALIHDHAARRGSQFIIATHSPILMAYPDATIYQLGDEGIAPIAYEDTAHFQLTRDFLANPARYIRHLLAEPD
jgi:predicted ATPase